MSGLFDIESPASDVTKALRCEKFSLSFAAQLPSGFFSLRERFERELSLCRKFIPSRTNYTSLLFLCEVCQYSGRLYVTLEADRGSC